MRNLHGRPVTLCDALLNPPKELLAYLDGFRQEPSEERKERKKIQRKRARATVATNRIIAAINAQQVETSVELDQTLLEDELFMAALDYIITADTHSQVALSACKKATSFVKQVELAFEYAAAVGLLVKIKRGSKTCFFRTEKAK